MWVFIRSSGYKAFVFLCVVTLFLAACGEQPSIEQDPTGGEGSTEEPEVEVPLVTVEVVSVAESGAVIPETTVILSEENASEVLPAITVAEDSLTFSSQELAEAGLPDFQVQAGEVLVIDPVEGAPNGMLRRVTAVSRDAAGNQVAETVPASLTEAVQSGVIDYSYEGDVLSYNAPGRAMGPAKLRGAPMYDLDVSHNFGDVDVKGWARIKPSFDIEIVIDNYQLKLLRFVDTTSVTGHLDVTTQLENAYFSGIQELFSFELSPTPIDVKDSILDMWVTPAVIVYVGAEGNITANITAEVEQNMTVNAGLFYPNQDGDFSWTLEPVAGEWSYDVSIFSTNIDMMAYVRPELTLQVFEFGGPYTGVDAFLRLDAESARSPLWQLFGGVRGNVGVRIKFLTFDLADWNYELLYEEWEIDRGGETAPVATEPPTPAETDEPSDTPEPVPTNTSLPPPTPTQPQPPPDASANVYMVYDDNAAAVINNSSGTISLLDVTFQRISDQGGVTAEFPSSFWGHEYSEKPITALPPGDCFIVSKSNFSLPAECSSVWSWFTTSGPQFYFWTATPGSESFQVLKGDQVVDSCAIGEGSCSFYLPQP